MTVGSVPDSDSLAAARRALDSAQQPRACGPGLSPDALRAAYLELLKLSLCDLAGTTTVSVGRTEEGVPASRELSGDQLAVRATGMDWPLQGLTMVGLDRLDDLQECVETIVRDGVQGDLIEAGTWRGGAAILIRATLDSLGESGRTVFVADSFQGFPVAQRPEDQWEAMDYLAVPLEEVRANFARLGLQEGVEFVPGFFADTLPGLRGRRWSLVRLDGDTYEATWCGLESLYPGLCTGGYLVIDDYGALPECRAAVDEFRSAHGVEEPLEQVDWTCVRWRRQSAPSPEPRPVGAEGAEGEDPAAGGPPAVRPAGDDPPAARPAGDDPPAARPAGPRIPSMQELALQRELESVRQRLASAEAELGRLRQTPLRSLRTRVSRRRGT